MFVIKKDKSIHITRGDIANIVVSASLQDGTMYTFSQGDVVSFKVYPRKNYEKIVLKKEVTVSEETETVNIYLEHDDTKLGDIINKPVDYWYEVEINPDTKPQTIIGYDEDGEKIFRVYPEGSDGE